MEREGLFELRRRTFDTPGFRGITFIEAEAKTIINHVPGSYLPFNYTINPYRGCSHACAYCARGDTPVLMADGRWKPIAEIQSGDKIYGTERRGNYRRYVETTILAHWSTVKPSYRVALEDGTELVTSGDHRFLTERGWKHVTGCEQGDCRRPFLTTNNKLMGTGRFAAPPEAGPDYRRGYLCGVIRGDGLLRSYEYPRVGRPAQRIHHFRLALVDMEALRRARDYLSDGDVITREYLFQQAVGARRELNAIGTAAGGMVAAVRDIVGWPLLASAEWCKGFLAGIFDAEGSYSRGILRISNTDPLIVDWVTACLRRFGFVFVKEFSQRRNGLTYVLVRGGLREHLRFFHTVDPAITRKRTIEGQAIKNDAPLRVISVEPVGMELPLYDMTTGTGDFIANGVVSHNCFARVTHTYLDMDAGRDFESKIVVKVNAPEVLRRQLGAKRWKGEHIAMGTATDPYQRAEGRYRLMRGIVRALIDYRNPFSILTKGTLILRDLDLLVEAASLAPVSTAVSVGTVDEEAWRLSEPGTPHPRRRLEVVARLNEAGIPCGVMVAPILPGITDRPEQLRDVVESAIAVGATHVSPILLHLRPGVKEEYMAWLEKHFPDLLPRYRSMYAGRAYAAREHQRAATSAVSELVDSAGGVQPRPDVAERFTRGQRWQPRRGADDEGSEQLTLL